MVHTILFPSSYFDGQKIDEDIQTLTADYFDQVNDENIQAAGTDVLFQCVWYFTEKEKPMKRAFWFDGAYMDQLIAENMKPRDIGCHG